MAIETIKAGDYVLSFDEGKKEKSYKKVTDTFVRTTDLIYTVSFVNGEKLETTWNHPFWVLKKSVALCLAKTQSAMITWWWYAIGKHGVTLQGQELHLVNRVLRVTAHKLDQVANLYF